VEIDVLDHVDNVLMEGFTYLALLPAKMFLFAAIRVTTLAEWTVLRALNHAHTSVNTLSVKRNVAFLV